MINMEKIIFTVMMLFVLSLSMVSVTQVMAITDESPFEEKIRELETMIQDKDKILFEQVKVILDLTAKNPTIYEGFSLEKFPETNGFNPAWLKGEHDKIRQTCDQALEMGYENPYCKFLQ